MITINGRFVTQPMTGVQRYAFEVTRRLGPTTLLAPGDPRPEYQRLCDVADLGTRQAVNRQFGGHIWEQFVLPSLLESSATLWSPCGAGPLRVHRQVVTIHDIAHLEHPEWYTWRFSSWYRFLIPRLAKKVRRIITGSEFTRSRLKALIPACAEKVVVIPYGVGEEFGSRNANGVTDVIRKLGIPSKRYAFTLVSLQPRKNLRGLLRAWKGALSRIPEDVWLIVGGARGRTSVFRDAGIEGVPHRVLFLGYVPESDLPALYAGALFFVYVPFYEGFGLPVVEAMASGAPAIVSARASLPEVAGDAAVAVDPDDIDSTSEALIRLATDSSLRYQLRQAGLARSRLFSWEETARLTLSTLLEASS
jgi:glycosyltransferase involved in cell wall biosynthesis